MAIYHLSIQTISRGKGKSVVASAAYRACEKLINEYDNIKHNYSHKNDLVHKEIVAPDNAADWVYDRAKLWNEVEKIETRKNAQLGRELNIALPVELDPEKQKELVKEFVSREFVDKGMIADICIHDKRDGNPHAHVMLTRREINEHGFGDVKKEWTGTQEYFKGRAGDLQKKIVEEIRSKWAEFVNKALEHVGCQQRVDHRSFKEQGINKVPTRHEGAAVRKMESKGIETEKGAYNRRVQANNKMLELIDRQINLLDEQREVLNRGREQIDRGREQTFGDRKLTITDESIIFGVRRENKIHSERADKLVRIDKKQNERGQSNQRNIIRGVEKFRKEEPRDNREIEQSHKGLVPGHGRLEEDRLREDRENIQDFDRRNEKERRMEKREFEANHGTDLSSEEDRKVNVERESKVLRYNNSDNDRDNCDSNRDMELNITIDSIVQALSKSIQKAEEKEESRKSPVHQKEEIKKDKIREPEGKKRDFGRGRSR